MICSPASESKEISKQSCCFFRLLLLTAKHFRRHRDHKVNMEMCERDAKRCVQNDKHVYAFYSDLIVVDVIVIELSVGSVAVG